MQKQRPLVGVLVNEPDRDFFSLSLNEISAALFDADMDAAIFTTLLAGGDQSNYDAENAVFDLVNFDVLDGLIVFLETLNGDKIKKSVVERIRSECNKPVVFVEEAVEGFGFSAFNNDEGARIMTEHLVSAHDVKTVDYVSGPKESVYHTRILNGYKKAFAQYGIVLPENRIHYGKDWTGDYKPIVRSIIENGLPDAIVCCSDFTASALVGVLTSIGIKVPADVIVVGYGKNEPFAADYFNITSIMRDPKIMAQEAAGKIIAQIKGEQYSPLKTDGCCTFETGVTCGCSEINYPALARAALDNMIQTRREGFDSYYNFMSEELIGAVDFEDYLWKLDWYTYFLGDIDGFWLCLNDNVMHLDKEFKGFTDKIDMPYVRVNKSGSVEYDRSFDKSILLPAIYEKRDKPCAFIFNALHFYSTNFGYTVMSYGSKNAVYDITYAKWFRYVTCALEKHRRHIIYNDAVTDAQIRDSLTGLLNMRGFKRIMTDRCSKFYGKNKLMRIISVDIENISGINAAYGYSEGDRVLQKLGVILNNCAGDDDICVRVSGDEFLIAGILDAQVPVDDVPLKLEKNLEAYNSGMDSDYGIHIYTSRVTAPLTSAEVLDTLPYEASYQRTLTKDNHNKTRKSSAVTVKEEDYDPEERRYVAKLLNDNLFTYHFQPIVNAKTGEIFAYEALMRCSGDRKLSPIAILNHASAMGRLGDVERHTMKNLFEFRKENDDLFEEKLLFVNSIPSCTLSDEDFDELYAKYKDIMTKVVMEFTEQTEASPEQLETILERSRKMGFKIAIDDYGTGYSNISNLLTFMPNCVKIDRSLIMNIHKDKRKQHFTKNIIDYAHDNNFMALAEGVELEQELKMVISMGVDLIQGYYTSKPAEKIIQAINSEIADEIKDYNRMKEERRVRKTYFTGSEGEVSLMSLDFDGYTDIFVSTDKFTLVGNKNYDSEISIRIKEGLDCELTLTDVTIKSGGEDAIISLGKNSSLTLNIQGDVAILGAVNVPETAEIDIVGDGSFTMSSSSNQTYAIGSDISHSYGNIGIHLNNRMFIHIDSEKCTAIGGGHNALASKIDIEVKELVIELSGKTTLAIGCVSSSAIVNIKNTSLRISQQCAQGIAIGSFEKSIDVAIDQSRISMECSGDKIGGICAYSLKCSSMNINNSHIDLLFKGKKIYAIGSDDDEVAITMHDCELGIVCEGACVIAMGSSCKDSMIEMYNCIGVVSVKSGSGRDLSVQPDKLLMDNCSIEITNNR